MKISKRHHYIPEFLIKGFTGNDGKLTVYNKQKKKFESLRKSPKQIFFEWNRNTFENNNEVSDFVERLYQSVENKIAPVYKRVNENLDNYELTPFDMFNIIYYINVLHSSLPIRDNQMEKYFKSSKKEDLLMTINNLKTNTEDINADLFYDRFKNNPSFIQASKIMKATIEYLKNDTPANLNNWKTYYSTEEVQYNLISDNPIILRNPNVNSIYNSELIFPFSKSIAIFHTKGKSIKQISGKDRVQIDVLMYLQADKYICGANGEYLEKIVELGEKYPNQKMIDYSKEQIFKIFE